MEFDCRFECGAVTLAQRHRLWLTAGETWGRASGDGFRGGGRGRIDWVGVGEATGSRCSLGGLFKEGVAG